MRGGFRLVRAFGLCGEPELMFVLAFSRSDLAACAR